jgi:hypothetical protein
MIRGLGKGAVRSKVDGTRVRGQGVLCNRPQQTPVAGVPSSGGLIRLLNERLRLSGRQIELIG